MTQSVCARCGEAKDIYHSEECMPGGPYLQPLPPEKFDIDLGDDHWLAFFSWKPDRELNPQYKNIPDVEQYGATVYHRHPLGFPCVSAVIFNGPVQQQFTPERARWVVEREDPLTLSPSLLCTVQGCGDHGYIRNGRWVRA